MSVSLFHGYRPHAGQAAFHQLGTRFAVVLAGTRAGKTYAAAREFLRRVYLDRAKKKGSLHYWCVAPTYAIGKTQLRELFAALGGETGELVQSWSKTERELRLVGEVLVEFKTAERPEALVGVGLDGLWVDEAARLKAEAWLGGLRMRLSDRRGWTIFSTTPLGRNWFYHEVVRRADPDSPLYDPDYGMARFRTVDNTVVPGLADEVEHARRTLPARYFRREYEADLTSFAGMVFDEFDPDLHQLGPKNRLGVAALPAHFTEVRAGVDWGFRNPGAIVVLGRDGDGVWWAIAEEVHSGVPVAASGGRSWVEMAKRLHRDYGIGRFVCDPSGPSFIAAFRRAGLPATPGDNDVGAGVQSVATTLHVNPDTGAPGLFLGPDCPNLAAELAAYAWDDEVEGEQPRKENDHTVDALRYALHTKTHAPAWW
jgi:hypothetical protein